MTSSVGTPSETAELELRIVRSTNEGYVLDVRFVPAGSEADVEVLRDASVRLAIDLDQLRELSLNPVAYSQTLTNALFGDPTNPVHQAFLRARDVTLQVGSPLRLRLFINSSAPELHSVRWEMLADPMYQSPLFNGANVIFSRYLSSFDLRPVRLRTRDHLRALVVIADVADAQEYGLAAIDVAAERQLAEAALAPIATTTVLATRGSLSLANIGQQLRTGSYDIFYLVAHGLMRDEAELFVENAQGEGHWERGRLLTDRLRALEHLPTLVVLASCQSAGSGTALRTGDSSVLSALGPDIAALGVPAVLAMQGNLSMATAARLLPAFFQELVTDGRVDRALCIARGDISDRHDWWMPALFTRLRRGRIWSDDPAMSKPLSASEIQLGLAWLEQIVPDHAPGLVERLAKVADELRELLATPLPNPAQLVELMTELDIITESIVDYGFAQLARQPKPTLPPPVCPFLGLSAFTSENQQFFFGREILVAELARRLGKDRFLAVVGPSGCGKSSLVRAGLIPAIQRARPSTKILTLMPGATPLATWAAVVEPARGRTLLLVIDQFEELFTLCRDTAEQREFIQRMLAFARRHRVVLTMRADFTEEATAFAELREALQKYQELIGPMEPAELRDAMERQAVAGGLVFEPGLSQRMFEEFVHEPGAMPLLQFALQELWKRRQGRRLSEASYARIGGVQQAIAQTADAIYESLKRFDQALTQHIFVLLTKLDDAPSGRELRDTRRRLSVAELVPEHAELKEVKDLLRRLADARLIVTSQGDLMESETAKAEIAHEALIRHWPRMRGWIDSNRQTSSRYEGVRVAAQEWEQHNRQDDWLIHWGQRLTEAQRYVSESRLRITRTVRHYLAACEVADSLRREAFLSSRVARSSNTTRLSNAVPDTQLPLDQARWAVVVNANDTSLVLKALWPLIELRMEQMGFEKIAVDFREGETCYQWYLRHTEGSTKTFQRHWGRIPPVMVYRPGDSISRWLSRHGTGHGIADKSRVPYYLLLIGKPGPVGNGDTTFIPFIFQYQLAFNRAIGRLHFEHLDHYTIYAQSVVAVEKNLVPIPPRVAIFSPKHRLDVSTTRGTDELALPLAARLRDPGIADFGWSVQSYIESEAVRRNLEQLLGGSSTPALLFITSHGLGLPIGDERLVAHQGAIVTQDWRGLGSIKREHWFAGEDVSSDARILGSMAFMFVDYGAGTPLYDEFVFDEAEARAKIAPHDFIAKLPQRLLSHSNGSMIAIIGHVERSWTHSFSGGEVAKSVITPHVQLMRELISSYSVGAAMSVLTRNYGEFAALLATELEELKFGKILDPVELSQQWVRLNDARNYVVLGDPATRLIVDRSGTAGIRPTLSELGITER